MLLEDTFSADYSKSKDTNVTLSEGYADPRLLNISYSSLLSLHSCPRRWELEKLGGTSDRTESESESITFSYGHCVGLGMALALQHTAQEDIVWALFLEWKPALFAGNTEQNKSFASAVYAVQKFQSLQKGGYLNGFSLVIYEGKPAVELGFIIHLPNGFKYRGFVDAVLRNDETGEVVVLECKTSSANTVHSATYRNSAQAIGYSIVLDRIFSALSSYRVIYLVYSTKQYEYESLSFQKSYVQRARWIRELILDCDNIASYTSSSLFPMRGESCMSFFRECKFLGLCEMTNDRLTQPLTSKILADIEQKNSEYQISITLEDLINTQLQKTEAAI